MSTKEGIMSEEENGELDKNWPDGANLNAIEKIKAGLYVTDSEFDQLYPGHVRDLSQIHWTSIQAAKRAAALAVRAPNMKVLDVGAGVGKFCTIGALTTNGFFVGLEQRRLLVEIADNLAARYKIPNAGFVVGNLEAVDWRGFDSIYLYNPFSENLDVEIRIDDTCELSADLYLKYVRYTQAQLDRLPSGVRVITYNGFGGEFPPAYECTHTEEINFMHLKVWDKR
jgi:hypothetical protein